jgi:HSP20 family protein
MDTVHEIKRIQDRMYGEGLDPAGSRQQRTPADAWTPTSEALTKGDDLVIRVELPGVKPEDIEITFMDGVLTVSGERERAAGEEEATFHVRERYYGAFRRSMTLPAGVNEDDISASIYDGVVEITVSGGGTGAPKPRRIQLKRAAD